MHDLTFHMRYSAVQWSYKRNNKINQNAKLREFSLQMKIGAAKFHQMKRDRLNFPRDSYYMYLNMHQICGKQRRNKAQVKVNLICVYIHIYINGKVFNCMTSF